MSTKTTPPTDEEYHAALRAFDEQFIKPYTQKNKRSISRVNAEIKKQIAQKKALAAKCEQVADQLYEHLMQILPEEHKTLLAHLDVMRTAQYQVQNVSAGPDTLRFYEGAVKDTQKLLESKAKAPRAKAQAGKS